MMQKNICKVSLRNLYFFHKKINKNLTILKFFKKKILSLFLVQTVLLEEKPVKLLIHKSPASRRWLEKRPISWWDASPRPFDHEACALQLGSSVLQIIIVDFLNNQTILIADTNNTNNTICRRTRWQFSFVNALS